MTWFVSTAILLLAGSVDPEECPCAEEKVNVTVIVILASENGSDVEKRLSAVAKEVRTKCPKLTNFELKSIAYKALVVDEKTMFATVDKKEIAVTIKRATDDENKVSLAVVAPEQGEIVLRCICGKFLPIITRYQTRNNERLILAIRVESCKGD